MRKGAKVCITRSALQDLLKVKDDGRLKGISYDAQTDKFCLAIEAEPDKATCKVGSTTVTFEDQMPETGNWPVVQL